MSTDPRDRVSSGRSSEIELFSLAGHDSHLREVNEAFARLLGLEPAALEGRSLLELVHPDDLPGIVAGLAALTAGTAEVLLENRFLQADGAAVHLQWVARTLPGTDLWWAAGRDVTAFRRLLSEQVDLRTRFDLALGSATAALWDFDVRAAALAWEPQAAEVLGVAPDALPLGVHELACLVHPDDSDALRTAFVQLLAVGSTEVALRVGEDPTTRHLSLRGRVLERDRRGRPRRAVGLVLDVTAEKAMEEQMLRMVMSDALTGVPNRRAFDQALRTEWRRCTRGLEPVSVLMVDIDHFKRFNDAYGHLVGDDALCAVARALTRSLHRAGDVLARFGGEEFAVVLPGVDEQGARVVAGALVEAVRAVRVRQAPDWSMSVSVGAASWQPLGSLTGLSAAPGVRLRGAAGAAGTGAGNAAGKAVELLAQADAALYAAKAGGRDRSVHAWDVAHAS